MRAVLTTKFRSSCRVVEQVASRWELGLAELTTNVAIAFCDSVTAITSGRSGRLRRSTAGFRTMAGHSRDAGVGERAWRGVDRLPGGVRPTAAGVLPAHVQGLGDLGVAGAGLRGGVDVLVDLFADRLLDDGEDIEQSEVGDELVGRTEIVRVVRAQCRTQIIEAGQSDCPYSREVRDVADELPKVIWRYLFPPHGQDGSRARK